VPSAPVPLPDLKNVKSLLPNVTFEVPKSVFDLLRKNDVGIFQNNVKKGSDANGSMLCGFNVPIITVCAFVLLNILLNILNLIFWWLPFVKICLPFPGRAPTQSDTREDWS